MNNDIEQFCCQLIANAGDARSYSVEAIRCARKKDFDKADEYLKQADVALLEAHKAQTDLLFKEANGEKTEFSVLLIHAQDHIMNAMTVKDLASELIEILKERG